MDKSFDFGALLRKNEKKHKAKPTQFVSVAGGVQKRLEKHIKIRKSTRLTTFDSVRDLPRSASPDPVSEAQLKVEHRRQQLEKWKAEKEQKKKEAAAQKKKPFLTGAAHAPLKFVPPPPPKPSTSGRVTRSQSAKNTVKTKTSPKQSRSTQSFAPKNALFRAPEIKTSVKIPTLVPGSKAKSRNINTFTFEPVIPNTAKQTRSKTFSMRQAPTETKNKTSSTKTVGTRSIPEKKKIVERAPRLTRSTKAVQSSTSSSDVEPSKTINRIKTPGPSKSKPKDFSPKQLVLESTSEDKSSDNSSTEKSMRKKSRNSLAMIPSSSHSSDKMSSDSSTDLNGTIKSKSRKSLPRNFTPTSFKSDSSSDKLSSDEVAEKSASKNKGRKSLPNTPKARIPKSESSSEEKLRSPKSPDAVLTPQQMEIVKKLSPCVTLSRGKENARREMKQKMDEGLLDDDTSDMESVEHFRQQLSSEVKRLTETCDSWDRISEQTALPEPVEELVLAAVGQARLLLSQRLLQFGALVERCAAPEPGSALVTPADLHGFWDMVFMQVENVDMRFKKLEELRARGWAEEAPAPQQHKPKMAARRARPAATSRIRDMIAAARKAKKDQSDPSCLSVPDEPENKTFEAGFFCVRSPVRSPMRSPATPSQPSLLKAVLSSEAKKASTTKNSTSFAMLRASLLSKNVECDGIAPLPLTPHMTPINLYATPGRSILKSSNMGSTKKSSKKSIKLVLFSGSDNESQETTPTQNTSDSNDMEMKTPMEGIEEFQHTDGLSTMQENVTEYKEKSSPDSNDVEMFKTPMEGIEVLKESEHTDSGLSSMDVEKITEQKENTVNPRKLRLMRQNAVEPIETDHVVTRSQRKSLSTPKHDAEDTQKSNKRSARQKKITEEEEVKTPRQSSRRKKVQDAEVTDTTEKTPKRSAKKKALKEVENIMEDAIPTPKRSTRRRKSAALQNGMT